MSGVNEGRVEGYKRKWCRFYRYVGMFGSDRPLEFDKTT